jgi:hypothetical protein
MSSESEDMPGSSDAINYSIRPNKSVERKLIVDALSRLPASLRLQEFRYIGMGAMWFVDFVLFHRSLRIQDMVSIEKRNYARANFNRPYSCIKVIDGETTPLLENQLLPLKDKRLVVWFDYDGVMNRSVLLDIELVCQDAQPGSILLITVNAHKNSYRKSGDGGTLLIQESLAADFGKLVPDPFPQEGDTRIGFQKVIGSMLTNHISRTVLRVRKSLEYCQMFDFAYEDGAPMVTVGGMICDATLQAGVAASPAFGLDYVAKPQQYRIEVPPLTFREKYAIDQLLPALQPPFDENLKRELEFALTQTQIENYRKFYTYYPLFWEILA